MWGRAELSWNFGWQNYGDGGEIVIPATSLAYLSRKDGRPWKSLRDVIRHEYGHAVADTHRGLIRSSSFTKVFGASHESGVEWEVDETVFVSEYSSEGPDEDFAETFMHYVKNKGKIPDRFKTPSIQAKWRFVHSLSKAISKGQRRW